MRTTKIIALIFVFISQILILRSPLYAEVLRYGTYQSILYSIKSPGGWTVAPSADGFGIEIYQPPENAIEYADLNFRVSAIKFPDPIEIFDQAAWTELRQSKREPRFETGLLGDYPAHKMTYDVLNSDPPLKVLRIYAKVDDVIYDLSFSCKKVNFEDYLPVITLVIESFVPKRPSRDTSP
jgi:hypothetical protein